MIINAETIHKASYINMKCKENSISNFEQFLKNGAQVVRQTEPDTALWFALKENNHFGIFDIFFNEFGRKQHFSGQVAKALMENASNFIVGGWDLGVLNNVSHYDIIASNHFNRDNILTAKEASYIVFKANPGKNNELEHLLKEGAQLIDRTEPKTFFWVALKKDENTYAVFDVFPDKTSKKEHFSGKVALELQRSAQHLIDGGWEKGVLENVHNFQILASS